jgi:hypothetical protein
MRITVDVDDNNGNMAIRLDREGVPPPVVHWMLLKAAAAVFNPPPQPQVLTAPAAALRSLNEAPPKGP